MDKLTDDLKLDIVSRLSMQMLGCLMCVSKAWHNLITTSHLATKFYGVAVREETGNPDSWVFGLFWYKNGMGIKLYFVGGIGNKTKLLDYCNGLYLLWLRECKSLAKYFVVFNPLTKQYVTIDKPVPSSRDRDFAVLAYDPYQSMYFKIVRFESSTNLKVFFSETGRWITLLYQLPDLVTKADWVRKCVYFETALYRLSKSGHLLRFELNLESKSGSDRVKAINLPNETERSDHVENCVGILNGQLCFSMSDNSKFKIWELQLDDSSYQWSLKYVISCNNSTVKLFKHYHGEKRVIAFHPYLNVVYSTVQHDIYKGNGFPVVGDGFCLSDQTSFEAPLISEGPNHARKRIHFHPVVLCLSQFASTKMYKSKGDGERKFHFFW